jgi:hypothetical protein
MLHLCYALTAA